MIWRVHEHSFIVLFLFVAPESIGPLLLIERGNGSVASHNAPHFRLINQQKASQSFLSQWVETPCPLSSCN